MHLTLFDYLLWSITPIVQFAVLVAMFRRKLHSLYPRFFAYTILQVVFVPVLALLFHRSYTEYYYSYFINLGLGVLVSIAVVFEVSRIAFNQDEKSLTVLRVLWTVIVLVGFLLLAATKPLDHSMNGAITDGLILAERAVHIFQIVLVIGFIVFSTWLQLSARSFVYGVVLGFGLFALVNMLVNLSARHHAPISSMVLSRVNGLTYLVATLIWLAYAMYGSPGPNAVERSDPESPTEREIREWIERNFNGPQMSAARSRNLI